MMKKSILFVCLGNICRSPAAEAVMNHVAATLGKPVETESAGVIGMHQGNPPDVRMRQAGEARGYRFNSRARQVRKSDVEPGQFDLVLAMDRENLRHLRRLAGDTNPPTSCHIRLFGDFLNDQPAPDVPDPYYGGIDGFEAVLDMLEAGCPKVLDYLASLDAAT